MDYGEVFANLLAQAIECEEAELKQLSAEYPDSKQTDTSIRKYYEHWISVALLKQAIRSGCPRIKWEENGRADYSFVEGEKSLEKQLASFEIKPFFQRFPAKPVKDVVLVGILKDFKKQLQNAEENSAVSHYVVLVPCGEVESIEKCITDLKKTLRQKFPQMTLADVPAPKPIKLNDEEGGYAVVKVFLVESLAQ